jgi:hypothetical protein
MTNNRDLLKEAIADAKAVKETAIANAKMALEEAFTPYLKEKFSAKLAEMDEEESEAERADVDKYEYEKGKKSMEEMPDPVMRHGLKGDDKEEKRTEYMKYGKDLGESEDMDEEMDLDELLAELDKELNEAEESESERADVDSYEYEKGKEDEEDKEDDEEIDLEDMSEDDLKTFIEDVIADMVKAGELEGEIETDEEDEESDDDVEIEVEDEEEVTIDEGLLDFLKKKKEAAPSKETDPNPIIGVDYDGNYIRKDGTMAEGAKQGYNAKLDDAEGAKHGKKKQDMKQRRADSENMEKADGKRKFAGDSQMKEEEEMAEMRLEVNELKSELNEVNLLNAKLLYVNKIFRAKNLNENQKAKVLGAFDKATSVTEVKLVFETLSEGLTPVKSAIKENRGSASRIMGNSTTKKPILEVNNQFERWQKLAGIK